MRDAVCVHCEHDILDHYEFLGCAIEGCDCLVEYH